MKYDKKTVIMTGIMGSLLGILMVLAWPLVQHLNSWWVTPPVNGFFGWSSIACFLIVMGYAKFGVIPGNSIVRNGGYVVGMLSILITLVPERNLGVVFLETFLLYITIWGFVKAKQSPEPFKVNWPAFKWGTIKLVIFISLGITAAYLWPVTKETQWHGWWWPWLAILGGVANSAVLFLLEMKFFKDMRHYSRWYAFSCAIVVVSYLGEYNFAGVVNHASLWLMSVYAGFFVRPVQK